MGQRTPFCSHCEDVREFCHFCLGKSWVRPPEWSVQFPHWPHKNEAEGEKEAEEDVERDDESDYEAEGENVAEKDEGWTIIPDTEA